MGDGKSDELFRKRDYDAAAANLIKGLEKEGVDGRDGLLYLLDIGLSLHTAGRYEESTNYFLAADRAAEIKDYTSLATEAGTLLTTDQIKQYKGEDFENVLISVYLAMNFAMQGKRESALVEAKRVNRKLYLMRTEGKRKYKQNAFARYLSAVLYEADGNWNDANVDYKFVADLAPDFPGIGRDLYAMAAKFGDRSAMRRLEEKYKLSEEERAAAKVRTSSKGASEIIVIFQNGISPRKGPDPGFHSIPRFFPRPNPVSHAEVVVHGEGANQALKKRDQTRTLMNIESVAIQNLEEKWGGLLAKKLAGVVAKEALGSVIDSSTGNKGIGTLVKLALYVSDRADTRSWNLLPKELQIARIPVPPGTYSVAANLAGNPAAIGNLPPKTIQVRPGEKVFVNFRYMP